MNPEGQKEAVKALKQALSMLGALESRLERV